MILYSLLLLAEAGLRVVQTIPGTQVDPARAVPTEEMIAAVAR
jgi:hypothetical protein